MQKKTKPFKCDASAFDKAGNLQTTSFVVHAISRADAFLWASNRATFSAVESDLRDPQVFQINGSFV